MKKCIILLLFCASALAVLAKGTLREKLDALLDDPMFETSQVGMMVFDLTDDQTIYQYHARQLMRPASTMKVMTAVTALDRLGGDYMYTTRLCHTGKIENRTLKGNLYCVGGFDPMLDENDVKYMVARLYELGVDTLQGRIYADRTMKEAVEYGEGWCWDDENPKLMTLSLGRKANFEKTLLKELKDIGIVLKEDTVRDATCPMFNKPICVRVHSIDQVLDRMMKKSDNFYAESMFYQIAASTGKPLCKATDAARIEKQLIKRIGLNPQQYRIADGSGLSLYNYVSAELLTMLLRYAWKNDAIYEHLAPSLPIAGIDGTLEKRMEGTAAQGNVRAKTGTVSGISSLAGYCTAANGHQLCFVIINQGVMRNATGRSFQNRVCKVLCEPVGEKMSNEGTEEVVQEQEQNDE